MLLAFRPFTGSTEMKLAILVILFAVIHVIVCVKFHILLSPTSQCPGELIGEPCLTLEQYVSYPSSSQYVTLQFEAGNHTLKSSFNISSRPYFGLIASGNATIDCNGQSTASVSFSSVNRVDIRGITFIRCGTVQLSSTTTGSIVRSSFLQTVGRYALYITSSNQVSIESCTFANNTRRAIYLSSTTATIMDSTFSDNIGPWFDNGGAVYSTSRSLTIIQSSFINNTAWVNGGAVYFSASSSYELTIKQCIFESNNADNGAGGAVYVDGNYGSANEPSSRNIFNDNRASSNGGALCVRNGNLYINYSSFTNNTASNGGAAYTSSSYDSAVINGIIFNNNSAVSSGGAIYMSNSYVSVAMNEISLINNIAGSDGGAVYTSSRYNSIAINGISRMVNNTAGRNGGAVYVLGNNNFVSILTNGTIFINNRAKSGAGGAIHIPGYPGVSVTTYDTTFTNNIGYTGGGALHIAGNQSSLTVNRSTFINNLITGPNANGGAVNVNDANVQSIAFSDSIFVNNSATNGTGGAIYAKRGFSVHDTIFGYNKAPLCAVVNVEQANLRLHRFMALTTSTFLHNSASGSTVRGNTGGVGCIRNADVSIVSSTFSHNTAAGSGGVFAFEKSIINVESSTFRNNTATLDGGVFYTGVFPSNYTLTQNTFINNRAGDDGGVIYVGRNGSFIEINRSSLSHNRANDRGGVAAVFGSSVNISDTNMQHNMANLGDDFSACSSNNNDVPTLNERIDPQHPECMLYDGTIRGHNEPIPHDNSDFDVARYFQKFVSVVDDPVKMTTPPDRDLTTELMNSTESSILRDIQNRLYGTSVIIYLMFTFAIILAITVVTVYSVKFIHSRKKALKGDLNAQDATCAANPYSESIELYEETDYGPGVPSSMPQKRATQFGKQQRYVNN